MLSDYIKFSWTSLKHRSIRSWLTLLGIVIGVTAVVALIGLGDGLKEAVSSQFGISATEVISVQAGGISGMGPPGTAVSNPLTDEDVVDIKRLSSVETAIARILESGKMEFNDRGSFGYAMSMPDGSDRDFAEEALDLEAEFGRLLKDGDNKKVVLGYNFGVDKLDFNKKVRVGNTIQFKEENFVVVGILKKKGSFIFDNIILMNTEPLKKLMDEPDNVDIIAVKVKNKNLMGKAASDIEKVLRRNRDVDIGEEDFEVQTPDAALGTVNSVLSGVQIFVVMIAAISILVGALGIVNTMTTAVLERKKQIGTMKAIGARNSDIFLLFFIESGIMGLVGGVIGAIAGTAISYAGTLAINNFIGSEMSPQINYILIIFTLIGTFIIGSAAGIIPAMSAAKEKPVDALRG